MPPLPWLVDQPGRRAVDQVVGDRLVTVGVGVLVEAVPLPAIEEVPAQPELEAIAVGGREGLAPAEDRERPELNAVAVAAGRTPLGTAGAGPTRVRSAAGIKGLSLKIWTGVPK